MGSFFLLLPQMFTLSIWEKESMETPSCHLSLTMRFCHMYLEGFLWSKGENKGEKTHERRNQEICLCRSVNFDRALRASQNKPDNDLYIFEKPRMSSFHSFSRFVYIIFVEEVMPDLVQKGQAACESGF